MGELPLIIFTLCMQAAIGILVFTMVLKRLQENQDYKLAALIATCLSIVGIIASLLHLGTPTLALNTLLNLGSSWLSLEILFSGGFTGLVVIYTILVYKKAEAKSFINIVGWIASTVGFADVFIMAKVYLATSVNLWKSSNTLIEFYTTMIILGIAILLVTNVNNMNEKIRKYLAVCVFVAVAVQVAFVIPYYMELGLMGGAATASATILIEKKVLIVGHWLLLILGSGILLLLITTEGKSGLSKYYVTVTAISIGLIIGRYLFYVAMVASRVGLT